MKHRPEGKARRCPEGTRQDDQANRLLKSSRQQEPAPHRPPGPTTARVPQQRNEPPVRAGRVSRRAACTPRGSQALPSPFPGRVQFGRKAWSNCCEDSKSNPARTRMGTFSSPFSLCMTACRCQCRATCYHGGCNSPAASPAASPGQHPQHWAEQNHLAADLLNLPGLRNVDVSPAKNRHKSEIT